MSTEARTPVELAEGAPIAPLPGTSCLVALAGNPNVGKSTLFNELTGMGVVTAHYAGKTLDVNVAETVVDDEPVTVVDLPGTYAIGGGAEDQWVARRVLLDSRPDVVVAVMDATNLARNLYLTLQLLDLGVPLVIGLNLTDEAERSGILVDHDRLCRTLVAEVVPTVATQGVGVDELMRRAVAIARGGGGAAGWPPAYDDDVECPLGPLVKECGRLAERPFGLTPRGLAVQLIEGNEDVERALGSDDQAHVVREEAFHAAAAIAAAHGEGVRTRMARERHALAERIADECVTNGAPARSHRFDLRGLTTSPVTGVPLLFLVLAAVFGFLFFVGEAMASAFSAMWAAWVSPVIETAVYAVLPRGPLAQTVLWGLDAGIEASLAIGLPYILTFYFLLALLEDSGYLNSVAFLMDRLMHRFGLHGRAIIPLVASAGCNVPAILATRVLPTKRERFIAATLAVMVPCSARTAVILGAVSHYIGIWPALGVFAIAGTVAAVSGVALDRMLPGRSSGLVMEMFPFRRPAFRSVARKAWAQFREFLAIAVPMVVAGSIILGGLYETGWLWRLTAPLAPVMEGWLGLPAVAGLTLLAGILRKELSLQLLATMAIVAYGTGAHDLLTFMTPRALFVYALVNTLAIPCVSTVAVLSRELGWRRTAGIVTLTVTAALFVGGIASRALAAAGWA